MAHFVESAKEADPGENGLAVRHYVWVNLDHAVKAKLGSNEAGEERLMLYGADGKVLGAIRDRDSFHLLPLIPAAPGTVAVCVRVAEDSNERPTESDVFTCERIVIAWRIIGPTRESPEPVISDSTSKFQWVLVRQPDGSLVDYNIGVLVLQPDGSSVGYHEFDNIEVAKACILAGVQSDWDARHRPTSG